MKNRVLHVFRHSDEVIRAAADFLRDSIEHALLAGMHCNLALAGGSSPRQLYETLAGPPYDREIEWNRVRFFFGDERNVPQDHPDSNFRMALKSLLQPLEIAAANIFPVDTSLPPDRAAAQYEQTIRNHLGRHYPFDIILLGLGDNAHTASLFPFTSVLDEKQALVREVYVEEVNRYRITFTAPLINAARTVVFLVYGSSKAAAVYDVLEGPHDYKRYPAQLVSPSRGEVHWFMDEAAAGGVDTGR